MLFGQCPNGGGDKLKGASLNVRKEFNGCSFGKMGDWGRLKVVALNLLIQLKFSFSGLHLFLCSLYLLVCLFGSLLHY